MGGDKLLLQYKGKTFLQRAVDLLADLHVFERIVVTSDARIKHITLPTGIRLLVNQSPESGLSRSVQIGLEAASGTHYLFLTADQPKLTSGDLLPLLESVKTNPDKIIYPTIDLRPCSPTIFPECFRAELLALSDDTGGRIVRDANPERCYAIKPENPANFMDIDSMEDFNDLVSC